MAMDGARESLVSLSGNERGGVIQGFTPIHSHVQLYLVQIILIVVMCFVLGQLVKKWQQPRVIAEVMAGVLLGPSALGAIPGFTNTLFPDESLEPLTLTAHLGLILFLFIVGLELDPALLRSNAKKAAILSLTGQGVTWVLSLGVSQAMITWMDDVESSTSFVLFIGVSLSVTAFPVLSRILGENSLLNTTVGSLVISAASVDEACVWCLLALVVSTANAGSPLDAFYVFLLLTFFVVIMLTVGRWALLRLVQQISGDDDTGAPSRGVVILCLLMTLVSAWVTDFIGIDAIFGAFVAGIIVPREHSLHVRIVELVQDVVSVLLLPLYFAVSGLKTDLTLLDNATSWGICVLTILAACLGKIGGGAAVARTFGMTKRESLAVGVLMNTRGLVELIILNIGLDAGVLTEEVMAIMVVMALVTTFLTAPLSALVYPLKYHTAPGSKRLRRASEVSAAEKGDLSRPLSSIPELGVFAQQRLKLMVVLTNPAALDAVARVARLFSGNQPVKKGIAPIRRKSEGADKGDQLVVHALRLVESTDRFSSDMRALEKGAGAGDSLNKDNLAGILQGFLGLLMIKVMSHVSVGTPTDFCSDVTALTDEHGISTVVFPWEARSTQPSTQLTRVDRLMDTTQCQFAVALNCHTAALAAATSAGVSLLVPFFGGDDDIAALLLALAIVERDSTAELVILSFLEPEKPPTGGGAINEGDGNESRRESESLMSRFVPSSESRNQSSRENRSPPAENKDIEAGVGVVANNAASPPVAVSAAGARPPAVDLPGRGQNNGGAAAGAALPPRRSTSTWSGRDLVKRAAGLPRVRVTPAWSLNAALGAMSASSPTTKDPSSTTASSIVQEVAAARSSGLVICGCAGSGQLPLSDMPTAPAEGMDRLGELGGNAPLAGASSVHGKWPSLGPLSRSKHNPTLSTRSWHGKSRQLGRSMHGSRHGPGGARVNGVRGGVRGAGGLASAVDRVIHGALLEIVGDIAGGLAKSEREPAVLAVRASIPVKKATV